MALRVSGSRPVDDEDRTARLRGAGLGGRLTMENLITGRPADETAMRTAAREAPGEEREGREGRYETFFADDDADLPRGLGAGGVRIPVDHRHLGPDDRPVEIAGSGFPSPGSDDRPAGRARRLQCHRPPLPASTVSPASTRFPGRGTGTGTPVWPPSGGAGVARAGWSIRGRRWPAVTGTNRGWPGESRRSTCCPPTRTEPGAMTTEPDHRA